MGVYSARPMTTNSFQGPFLAIPEWAVSVIKSHGQPRDLQVLVGLVALMERRTKEVTASVQQISEHVGVSKETTKRSLKWLVEYGVITVRRRRNPSVNVYTVHYMDAGMGSRVTLDGVTGDPMLGSWVTLAEGTTGVTGDPSYPHFCGDLAGETQSSIEVVIERVLIEKKERAASGTEDEMIIGADPDESRGFDEAPSTKRRPRFTNRLLTHFTSNRQSIMSSNYSQRDLVILRRTLNMLTDSGLTEFTVMQMINKFFSVERWRSSDNPALLFCSKDIQSKLLDQIEAVVETDDPVLLLMLNDFDRADIDLSWDQSQDLLLKRAIIMRGTDICYRYPEVVATLAHRYAGDFVNTDFINSLGALNSLVRCIIGEESEDPAEVLSTLKGFPLPDELQKLSKTLLRQPASSIVEAVYNYRRASHGR